MCDGGVAIWNRSSGPSPRAWHQCAVPRAMEAWVWRTAFGPVGRPRTEHEDRLVGRTDVGDRRGLRAVDVDDPRRRLVVEIEDAVAAEDRGQEVDPRAVGHGEPG